MFTAMKGGGYYMQKKYYAFVANLKYFVEICFYFDKQTRRKHPFILLYYCAIESNEPKSSLALPFGFIVSIVS